MSIDNIPSFGTLPCGKKIARVMDDDVKGRNSFPSVNDNPHLNKAAAARRQMKRYEVK